MDKKILTWPNSQGKSAYIRVRIRFRCQRCDKCVDLHDLSVKNGRSYSQFVCGFIMLLRGKEKCSEGDGDQSIIGDIPIRSSPKHYC